jgi:AraC family transcriptional regulator
MKVYIKNMVCQGTKNFVLLELRNLGINYKKFEIGEIDLEEELSSVEIKKLEYSLRKYGLAIVFGKSALVEKIKNAILDLVENNRTLETSFSYYISKTIGKNYTYLNKCFREEAGIPMEEYYMEKKTEKMKLKSTRWADVINLLGKSA